jgi:serine/threonine-protein kinase
MVGGDVTEPDEIALLTGLARAGAPEAAVRRAIADTAPGISVDWHVVSFDGPYCRALDILRPLATRFAAPSSGFVLALAGDKVRLQDGELITLHLTTPDFPAYLQVDYLQHDGSVYHMHPTPTDPSRLYPAGSRQSLGDPTVGGAQWAVSEPYGTEIITAVASSVPLFAKSRPESETNDAYLRDLQTALDAAKKKGARLAVGAVILDTEPKKAK